MFTRKTILKKTIQVGGSTLVSRVLGIAREMLMGRYLGATGLSDAFLTAFRIPNALRKVFAEGALSAALVPTVVHSMKHNQKDAVNSLIGLSFVVFEGIVLGLCALAIWHADIIIKFSAPGFSVADIAQATPFLQILMPLIFFLSTSALLAGPLHAEGHFFVPAFSPVMLNVVFIGALIVCLNGNLPVTYLCWAILAGGFLQLLMHIAAYIRFGFSFGPIGKKDLVKFGHMMVKFLLCLPAVSILEVSLFVDSQFASFLPAGNMTLLYYANRFMAIPHGVFAVALSTILLPHFSRLTLYAPKRLSFYLLEATKLVAWVTLPMILLMIFFADEIFITIFMSDKFSHSQALIASNILIAFLLGLFFLSLNKIMVNMFYALGNTWVPAVIAGVGLLVNITFNTLLVGSLQAVGLALATSISTAVQTIIAFVILRYYFNFRIYSVNLCRFLFNYSIQLFVLSIPFMALFYTAQWAIGPQAAPFWITGIGFWLWAGPLASGALVLIWYTRRLFGVNSYFID